MPIPARRALPFLGLWSLGAALIVRTALRQPAPVDARRHFAPDSWGSVATALLLMAAETTVVAVILLRKDGYRLPERWLLACVTLIAWTFVFGMSAMHASNAIFLHVMWLAFADAILAIGTVGSAIVRAIGRAKAE